jgi:hypothetical protein
MKYKFLFIAIFYFLIAFGLKAQIKSDKGPPSTPEEIEKQYKRNIKKSIINGVYIPVDINDAMKEMKKLSSPESMEKFKNAPENIIAKKLHFGLGRWLIYNWNFYYGSRLEHYLKGLGIEHPDDMADFLIISFHRYLNGKDLDSLKLAEEFHKKRIEMIKKSRVVIDTIRMGKP